MNIEKIEFESIYIDIYKLSEGIYATIFNQEMGASSNAGFFDLGNITIIFDTLMDPFATKDLIKASKSITNKDPFLLINSHFHQDHVFGNRFFPNSMPIMSSPGVFNQFDKKLLESFERLKKLAPTEFKRTEELLQKEKDPKKILELKNDLATYKEIQESDIKFRPPDLLLHDKIVIRGTRGSVEIHNVGNTHSYDDIIAYFPGQKICFMGDLLFSELDPNWVNGINGTPFTTDPQNFRDVMKSYFERGIEIYVPGHGPLCSKKEVKNTIDFLEKNFLK